MASQSASVDITVKARFAFDGGAGSSKGSTVGT